MGKGKKAKKELDPNVLSEVDKTFYELQITDLNKKLARLRSLNEELLVKSEQLAAEKDKLDEDRNDVIAFLKKSLSEKSDQILELEDRIEALEAIRQSITKVYEEKITTLNFEYKHMREQLISEIKLCEGKLNSLDEFKSQRDDLMKKYEAQEIAIAEQEERHKREMGEFERKFILSKDQLKKDMGHKLLELSTQFQDATELRIAATTHRVIRENIAVNNELDILLNNQQRLFNENMVFKDRDSFLRNSNELLLKENKISLAKVRVQKKLIEYLADDHHHMSHMLKKYKAYENEALASRNEIKSLNTKIFNLNLTKRILEQNLHNARCDRTIIKTDFLHLQEENARLMEIMLEAVSTIRESLVVRQSTDSTTPVKAGKRENVLNYLLVLLNKSKEKTERLPSLDSVSLFEATYAKGDLGFVPKIVELRSHSPIRRHMDTQTGASFEEYVETGEIAKQEAQYVCYDEEAEDFYGYQQDLEAELVVDEVPRKSVLFFEEQEMVGEESEEVPVVLEEEEVVKYKPSKGGSEFTEGAASELPLDEDLEGEFIIGDEEHEDGEEV